MILEFIHICGAIGSGDSNNLDQIVSTVAMTVTWNIVDRES